ncbi:MAG: family 43 glycosylhydrolase [Bacteroidaceae bacterium]|nr:family 43 glycosylhydrolase [Bacteroidaceae bacterium]
MISFHNFQFGFKAKIVFLSAGLIVSSFCLAQNEYFEIKNDCFWNTVEGKPIYSQGGGIFLFENPDNGQPTYYWYGNHYKEAEQYREYPRKKYGGNTFVSVSCYSSTDMVNWHEEADVLTAEEANGGRRWGGWLGRLGVGYLKDIKKYVLLMQQNNSVLICTSDSPKGPFKKYRNIIMTSLCGTPNSGDQTVFVDPDTHIPYLVYSNAKGRNRTYISEIGIDEHTDSINLLTCKQVFNGESREGNCMFKHYGKYYLYASNIYGWDCSFAYYLVSNNIYGPYLPENNMLVTKGCEADFSHVTQTGFFANLKGKDGKELILYYGDRWANFANNGLGYNQVVPMSFENDGTPIFNSMSAWKLCPATLDWHVSDNNNFVKNGSFEADRRLIPEPTKPRQDVLTGWTTTFIQGSPVGNDFGNGIKLNIGNSEADEEFVVGKMSLLATDIIPFVREVSQEIKSETYIPFDNGKYVLRFKIKKDKEMKVVKAFVTTGGKTFNLNVNTSSENWESHEMDATIKGNSAIIGFHFEGPANAQCRIDDVELCRK